MDHRTVWAERWESVVAGAVIGHGSYDGKHVVTVPRGLEVRFFTEENSPLMLVNLLALLRRDHHRTPMHTAKSGTTVPNYVYEPMRDYELDAIKTFDQLTDPVILVGTPGQPEPVRLCETPDKCKGDAPHTCGGVFGAAARGNWGVLLVLSCRLHLGTQPVITRYLTSPTGCQDTSVFDELFGWVGRFLAMAAPAQDATWDATPGEQQLRLYAVEDEIREWADCYFTRRQIAADRAKAISLVKEESVATRFRLLRDYPALGDLVVADPPLVPTERQRIADFLRAPRAGQVTTWAALSPADQVRWLTVHGVPSWAAADNALTFFAAGLRGDNLVGLLRKLDPVAKKAVQADPALVRHLQDKGVTL
ncbi:putative adhesin [Actinokineospora inagensis]|uniref:putative adhesin n=1 Tax=Actinokineospora inagensis TaxID=103730 RepID=UPI00047C1DFE|nr:hypothetical protein [Actinokineospora inagensis]